MGQCIKLGGGPADLVLVIGQQLLAILDIQKSRISLLVPRMKSLEITRNRPKLLFSRPGCSQVKQVDNLHCLVFSAFEPSPVQSDHCEETAVSVCRITSCKRRLDIRSFPGGERGFGCSPEEHDSSTYN